MLAGTVVRRERRREERTMDKRNDQGETGARPLSRRGALRAAGLAAGGLAAARAVSGGVVRPAAAQQGPAGPQVAADLIRLAEDTYVWRFGGYNSMIIVTDDGVIVADPCSLNNPRAGDLLAQAIRTVANKPVKYLVYSHDHADHNTGGAVFAETAEIVSHRLAAPKIAARNDPRSPAPSITFEEFLTLELGGKTVELMYLGRNHSDNSIVLHYPARRALFAVDFIPVESLPFRTLTDSYIMEWLDSLRRVEALDFDTLVPGHGNLGTRDNARQMREYFLDLMAAIGAARARGLVDNSEEMVAAVRADLMPKYGRWASFGPFLPENIEGIIREGAVT